MGATSVTRSYTSIVASVLDKVRDKVEDQITRNNKLPVLLQEDRQHEEGFVRWRPLPGEPDVRAGRC